MALPEEGLQICMVQRSAQLCAHVPAPFEAHFSVYSMS